MHNIFFVTVDKENAEDHKQAEFEADDILEANSFSSEGGYYSNAKADWHVVGGRYNGLLQLANKPDFKMQDEEAWQSISDDDKINAVELTQDLIDNLRKVLLASEWYKDDVCLFDNEDCEEYNFFTEDFSHLIGKWIVLIDYHY